MSRKSLSRPRKKLKNSAQFRKTAKNVEKRRAKHALAHPNDVDSLKRAKPPLTESKKRK